MSQEKPYSKCSDAKCGCHSQPGSEKATPRPWRLVDGMIMSPRGDISIHSVIDDVCISEADAALIVEAVNGWDALKEENRRLSARVKELEAIIHDNREGGF